MLLSIIIQLLVLFCRKSLVTISRVDPSWKPIALAAMKKEFQELSGMVELMDRLSRRKDANRVEGAECQKMMADRDFAGPPVCRKILGTVKVVAMTLVQKCEQF
jgi:hypothetical protein